MEARPAPALVTLLEAARLGGEASWAGAGMLAPGGEVTSESPWSRLALDSWRAYGDYVEELENESGEKIDYRVCGAVEPAYSEAEWSELVQRAEHQELMGIPSLTLTPDEAVRRAPPLSPEGLVGARWYPADAIVNPRDVMKALHIALNQRGVAVRENVRVTAMTAEPQAVRLAAGDATIQAEAAVLAAGAWASAIRITIDGERWRGTPRVPDSRASYGIRTAARNSRASGPVEPHVPGATSKRLADCGRIRRRSGLRPEH